MEPSRWRRYGIHYSSAKMANYYAPECNIKCRNWVAEGWMNRCQEERSAECGVNTPDRVSSTMVDQFTSSSIFGRHISSLSLLIPPLTWEKQRPLHTCPWSLSYLNTSNPCVPLIAIKSRVAETNLPCSN